MHLISQDKTRKLKYFIHHLYAHGFHYWNTFVSNYWENIKHEKLHLLCFMNKWKFKHSKNLLGLHLQEMYLVLTYFFNWKLKFKACLQWISNVCPRKSNSPMNEIPNVNNKNLNDFCPSCNKALRHIILVASYHE